MTYFSPHKGGRVLLFLSMGVGVFAVFYMAAAREPYAAALSFLLLLIKGGACYAQTNKSR